MRELKNGNVDEFFSKDEFDELKKEHYFDVTTRYSAVEVAELYRGVESLCGPVLGGNILAFPAKLPQASTSEKAIVR